LAKTSIAAIPMAKSLKLFLYRVHGALWNIMLAVVLLDCRMSFQLNG